MGSRNLSEVKYDLVGHAKSLLSPARREREMSARREGVRETVKKERCLMRKHPGAIGPKPRGDEVLMLTGWKMYEPIDPTANSDGATGMDVVDEELGGIPGFGSLAGCEQPVLRARDFEETVPIGARPGVDRHARNLSHTLVLCKRDRGGRLVV